jgi:hypothetical protein
VVRAAHRWRNVDYWQWYDGRGAVLFRSRLTVSVRLQSGAQSRVNMTLVLPRFATNQNIRVRAHHYHAP